MIPWTDQVTTDALKNYTGGDATVIAYYKSYKGNVQFYWAIGAIVGSFMGAQVAVWFEVECSTRRTSYQRTWRRLGLESINTFTKLKVNYVNFGGQKMNWG